MHRASGELCGEAERDDDVGLAVPARSSLWRKLDSCPLNHPGDLNLVSLLELWLGAGDFGRGFCGDCSHSFFSDCGATCVRRVLLPCGHPEGMPACSRSCIVVSRSENATTEVWWRSAVGEGMNGGGDIREGEVLGAMHRFMFQSSRARNSSRTDAIAVQ
jgi:hypothetical protein